MIEIYDTTLRDGSQREGLSLTVQDKLRIARRLDAFGVAFIEGGWPGSNPKDRAFFERAADVEWEHARLAAFGATCRANTPAHDDPSMIALTGARTAVTTLFGKSSVSHVRHVLRTSLDENLRMIEDSCAYLQSHGKTVIYDAEHFFDGFVEDAIYALETLKAAQRGGAEVVVLCETNGGGLPWIVGETTAQVCAALDIKVGVHAHNDTECAVANTLAAVRSGARHVQGTINGYGERCGNANLCSIIANLELKLDTRCLPSGKLRDLSELARFVSEVANLSPDEHLAYVGRSAFAHKGGVHVAALRRHASAYQHIEPELVGNTKRVVVSELSGRANVLTRAEELGVELEGAEAALVLAIKEGESKGISYEAAEASVALLIERRARDYTPLFRVIDYQALVASRAQAATVVEATVKVRVGQREFHTAAQGNGPVSALDAALRKALDPVYPEIAAIHLSDYKVRILDGTHATRATTRVLIDSSDEERAWSTVGASANIIEASFVALVDGIEYGLRARGIVARNAPPMPSQGDPS
ncbi:MAG: citramalate synthase [Nannocystaceae bacterium]